MMALLGHPVDSVWDGSCRRSTEANRRPCRRVAAGALSAAREQPFDGSDIELGVTWTASQKGTVSMGMNPNEPPYGGQPPQQPPYGTPPPPPPYGAPPPPPPYGAPQGPYGAPQQPYGAPQQPYGAPPQQPYGGPPSGSPNRWGPTSLGMDANVAAGLSYIWIIGLIFFFVEKTNRFVKFHAAQAILLGIVGIVYGILESFVSNAATNSASGGYPFLTCLFGLFWLS